MLKDKQNERMLDFTCKPLELSYVLSALVHRTRGSVIGLVDEEVTNCLDALMRFGKIYDILVLWSKNYIAIYNGNEPLMLNPAFQELVGIESDETMRKELLVKKSLTNMYYEGVHKIKVIKYLGMLQRNEIQGYKNAVFNISIKDNDGKTTQHPISWSTFMIPGNITIRMGIDVGIQPQPEEIMIKDFDLIGNLYFSRKLDYIYRRIMSSKVCTDTIIMNDIDKMMKNYRLMSITADIMLHEGPNPITIYKGAEPIILNDSFIKATGYTREEMMDYYNVHGEMTTLLYKGDDLRKVLEFLDYIKKSEHDGDGYKDVDFIITTKSKGKVTIIWNTYKVGDLTIRSGTIKN